MQRFFMKNFVNLFITLKNKQEHSTPDLISSGQKDREHFANSRKIHMCL